MPHSSELDCPVDLFYPILFHVEDLPFLWTNCRAVSRNFARAAEQVFVVKHLRKTWFNINGGWWYSEDHGKVLLSSNFAFDRMDTSNLSRAIFAEKECAPGFRKKLIARLRSRLEYGNPSHNPKILVQIRQEINDTAVPGLEVDFDRLELSCEWKGVYSAFFREEVECKVRMKEEAEARKESILQMRAQIEGRELNEMDALGIVFDTFCDSLEKMSLEKTQKNLRRERICREVLEKDGVTWTWYDGEDDGALRRLQECRAAIGCGGPFSDENDADAREQDEDQDQSEGDNWEEQSYNSSESESDGNSEDAWDGGSGDEDEIQEE